MNRNRERERKRKRRERSWIVELHSIRGASLGRYSCVVVVVFFQFTVGKSLPLSRHNCCFNACDTCFHLRQMKQHLRLPFTQPYTKSYLPSLSPLGKWGPCKSTGYTMREKQKERERGRTGGSGCKVYQYKSSTVPWWKGFSSVLLLHSSPCALKSKIAKPREYKGTNVIKSLLFFPFCSTSVWSLCWVP